MKKLMAIAATLTLVGAAGSLAQTTPQPTTPSAPTKPPAQQTMPPATAPTQAKPATPSNTQQDTMTDAQAKIWISKPVYSSDGSKLGSVHEIKRDSSGKILELQADMGGFLGIGETRVKVTPNQFRLRGNRVLLTLTKSQAKELPKVDK